MPFEALSESNRISRAITKNLTTLCETSVNIQKINRSLIESEIIDEDQREEIVSKTSTSSQFQALYVLLKRRMKDPKTYPAMEKALKLSGNEEIVNILKTFEKSELEDVSAIEKLLFKFSEFRQKYFNVFAGVEWELIDMYKDMTTEESIVHESQINSLLDRVVGDDKLTQGNLRKLCMQLRSSGWISRKQENEFQNLPVEKEVPYLETVVSAKLGCQNLNEAILNFGGEISNPSKISEANTVEPEYLPRSIEGNELLRKYLDSKCTNLSEKFYSIANNVNASTLHVQFLEELCKLKVINSYHKKQCKNLGSDFEKNKYLYNIISQKNEITLCIVALENSDNYHIIRAMLEHLNTQTPPHNPIILDPNKETKPVELTPSPCSTSGKELLPLLAKKRFRPLLEDMGKEIYANTLHPQFRDELFEHGVINSDHRKKCKLLGSDKKKNKYLYNIIFKKNEMKLCIVALEESDNHHIIRAMLEHLSKTNVSKK